MEKMLAESFASPFTSQATSSGEARLAKMKKDGVSSPR
jgi:hypothetical protein